MKYKIKATTLSPIHIGTSEVYEPVNYVIDNGYLYYFDEYKFIKYVDKKELANCKHFSEVYRFVKQNKDIAKNIFQYKVKVSKQIENLYRFVGLPKKNPKTNQYQKDKFGNFIYNQMQILKHFKTNNIPTIPGSSIKGSIKTFFDENISVSDTTLIKANLEIGFAQRVYKNRLNNTKRGIAPMVEVVSKDSEFEFSINVNNLDKLILNANRFYSKDKFYKNFKENSFLLRVGRFVGREFMIKHPKPTKTFSVYKQNRFDDSFEPFGWLLCEIL